LHRLASGTKGLSEVLAAAAVQDGLLGWDERVADTITEGESDPQKLWITENR
jgi:CubicO group peptidase (beta-lactamase class C family)